MDDPEQDTPKAEGSKKVIQSVQHELNFNNNIYLLTIEMYSNEKINFNLRQINNISLVTYNKEYEYEKMINILLLHKNYYNNISKVYKFLCTALSKNKIELVQENNKMQIQLKKTQEFDEINCIIDLDERKMNNKEMFNILSNEIKELKLNNNINKDIINNLIKKNNDLENKLNLIIEQNQKDKEELVNKLFLMQEENKNIMLKNQQLESNMNFLVQENNKMQFNLNQNNIYIQQIDKQYKEEIKMMNIKIDNLNCLNNNAYLQGMNNNNIFNNNYLNKNRDSGREIIPIPGSSNCQIIDDYPSLNNSQKMKLWFHDSTGRKVLLSVPTNMEVKDVLRLYCRKLEIAENVLRKKRLIFFYNGSELDINETNSVNQILRDQCTITVFDQ